MGKPGPATISKAESHLLRFQDRVRRLFSRENLPKSRAARITMGVALVIGGVAGFLPILGFWMIPVGLAILAIDIPAVRRFTRKVSVAFGRWRQKRHAQKKHA